METQAQVRDSFWNSYPEFQQEKRSRKRQNDYRADIRMAWCDHVDTLARDGAITKKLAAFVTL